MTTTDAFTAEDLLGGAKTAIIIHEKADNFANIPPERYQQVNGDAAAGRNHPGHRRRRKARGVRCYRHRLAAT